MKKILVLLAASLLCFGAMAAEPVKETTQTQQVMNPGIPPHLGSRHHSTLAQCAPRGGTLDTIRQSGFPAYRNLSASECIDNTFHRKAA